MIKKTQQELATELNDLTIEMKAMGKKMAALLKQRKPTKSSKEEIEKIDAELSILNEEISKINKRSLDIMELQGYSPKNSSVTDKKNGKMSTIDLSILGKTRTFSYSITKTTDNNKVDRYWDFNVTHDNSDLEQIPQKFSFRHDSFNNITEGKIGTFVEYVSEQIMMKELP